MPSDFPPIPPNAPVYFKTYQPNSVYRNGHATFRYPGFGEDVIYKDMPPIVRGVIAAVAMTHWMQIYAALCCCEKLDGGASDDHWMSPEEAWQIAKQWQEWGNI